MESIWKSDTSPSGILLIDCGMWKIRGTLLLLILLWVGGALGYRAASAEKLRVILAPRHGPGVVVEKVTYHDTYAFAVRRRGEAVFSVPAMRDDPRNPRGFSSQKMVVPVESRGRWWPDEVQHGPPRIVPAEKTTP